MSALEGLVVRRTTTAQQVADGLSERILAGVFKPGERLREAAIATELGIARNTVREAVRMLEFGGLVRCEVNRGAVVISPTPSTVDELYTARERLETAALARPLTSEGLATIEAAFDNLVQVAASHDQRRIVEADLALHTAMVSTLGSERISRFHAELTRELRFYLMALSSYEREFEHPDQVVAEHEPIMAAIRAGDHDRAVREASHHIAMNAERVQRILASGSVPG
ncbi:GntR family transcriptional regulator [Amycolatopsis taiwanensis]|uniref:GntR family transcriptional regulator n=1 Tax=Amycolatopsis taiwanensis TaxID=342230 RepID=A0A9W6VJ96_9PSEU|nr:GntR family transcriptional regulator [Amycolatopsis taiwanensis]GLY69294.1 GntR family transcriptional regulator [Amycolatopsis taiwanensis]